MKTTPQRDYFPILLQLTGHPCLVIGGGRVAYRKIESLLQAGARVTVISPQMVPELEALAAAHAAEAQPEGKASLRLIRQPYALGDLKGYRLAFAATGNREVNEACRQEAEHCGVLLNVVDVPDLCDFIMPAVHQQGDLLFMVCSQGKSPMLTKRLRKELQQRYGPAYGRVAEVMGELRQQAFQDLPDIHHRREVFRHLIEDGPLDEALTLPPEEARQHLWAAYGQMIEQL
ncbi:bifunctional precorrin-2 dehydrogenase/sirohydrochlorin ferrochelatase [Anoxynatronum sibiricum]|uniref:precorrin-2 dehydrogenase n=1 Tax=Anoxynatronum sibiricum TaxID=210623 RepID=A0ABU9VW15_9CLOT